MSIKFEDYANKYKHIKLERRNGILQVTLHTDGKDLVWGAEPHDELSFLFGEIARDPENRVVILTGTGETFAANPAPSHGGKKLASADWEHGFNAGKHLLMNHLAIEAPMIAAIN
jgi:enoyl-CoA hydratase/carnithine racemase